MYEYTKYLFSRRRQDAREQLTAIERLMAAPIVAYIMSRVIRNPCVGFMIQDKPARGLLLF